MANCAVVVSSDGFSQSDAVDDRVPDFNALAQLARNFSELVIVELIRSDLERFWILVGLRRESGRQRGRGGGER
jgi:hypothetical protein